jgi:hypothetical protein
MSKIPSSSFTAIIEKFNSNLWGFHFCISAEIGNLFITEGNDRRVICTLNGKEEFQCALMPKGDGNFFINVNKKLRDALKLNIGSVVNVLLKKDESEYGLPMPEELQELLLQDEDGDKLFHALTIGKQRTLLYIVGSVKDTGKRISRALAIVNHLKANGGKINYKKLNEDLKNGI